MSLPAGVWTTTQPITQERVTEHRAHLERAAAVGWPEVIVDDTRWKWQPFRAEVTQDPEELPDDQIVPDNTEPLPDEPEIKTDPVDDE